MSFDARSETDLLRLIEEYPLAWVVSTSEHAGFGATPLPLLAETDAQGQITALFGHFALRNPQVEMLRAAPRARILFSGPQGYISPEWVSKPGWGPTWNYATAQFVVDIEFVPEETGSAVERLVTRMERDLRAPWTVDKLGDRYSSLVRRIIAFRAHVRHKSGRFKLGQDESAQTLTEILAGIPDPTLARWMKDFNTAVVEPPAEPKS